ncbi:hypothetical protein IV203_027818 [Nitzschia inconspicua]|uniref:Uncharacterized protein n=1 Tax=Nitzschia inconspicua TaxID=303405 RepID=A0A9K3LXR2_9STRA|nr:hypothetical protein IV203_027818 [Nitzschia inconspicua]
MKHSNLVLFHKVNKGDFRVVENDIVSDGTRALGGEALEELFDVAFRRRKLDVVQIRMEEVSKGSGELESVSGEEGHLGEGGSKSGIKRKVLWITVNRLDSKWSPRQICERFLD